STATTRPAPISIPSNTRRLGRCAKAPRKWKWFWSREFKGMPKGYWIVHIDVRDPDGYQKYVEANAVAFARHQARFPVRGGNHVVTTGASRARHVVIEFRDSKPAVDCHNSREYQQAAILRDFASVVDLVIVEGYDGPQPG